MKGISLNKISESFLKFKKILKAINSKFLLHFDLFLSEVCDKLALSFNLSLSFSSLFLFLGSFKINVRLLDKVTDNDKGKRRICNGICQVI